MCFLLVLATTGCFGGYPSTPITSASGEYTAFGAPSGPEAGDDTACVVIHVTDKSGHTFSFQTQASDNMKWALAWSGERRLVLYSSDMGTTAYGIDKGVIEEREPTEYDYQTANDAYVRTYGVPPTR